ncbi:MAG: phosphoglucomutase/phosphomannomutase family protein [Elusimicrobia bacterium]|nr:phosphoglucomutase/phosphomannomutase family protein [Candidatus Liberimonas magnetica]
MKAIKFGTDGWRGIIADDFTFDNVRQVAGAIGLYLKENTKSAPKVIVGYDTRFASKDFAAAAGNELVKAGCIVILSSDFLSTPAVSLNIVKSKADGGVVISASHNPSEFNGIKFKTRNGSSAPSSATKRIEELLSSKPDITPQTGSIETRDLTAVYLKAISSFVDLKLIKRKYLKIISDPMYGAAVGYIPSIFNKSKCKAIEIHGVLDPNFGGLHPEPIEGYLSDLKISVKQNGADIGLATDGDADRIGVVDERGTYYPPHLVFPILLYYLCRYKNLKGKVVQTISLGYLSERIAKDFGLEWEEVSVGFKYIADKILTENILIGGEESGGYGYGNFLPERDGVLNSLVLIEMLAATKKSLSAIRKEIEKDYGTSSYLRTDFQKPKNAAWTKEEFVQTLKLKTPDKIAGLKIKQVKDYDGIEFVLEDDSWLLLRPSGTEPVIRVYCESPSLKHTKTIIASGEKLVTNSFLK